ncbi:MAG TPA: twin-arginine translocase subunit TatC [Thermoanaerobaculia bacterium]|nr:twin-arginine translocase subunit TatC [Thermoanaerobaculia bacterium]
MNIAPNRDREPGEEELPRMGFFDHLEELRRRLIWSILAVAIAFVGAWTYSPTLFHWIEQPILPYLPKGNHLAFTTMPEPFILYFRVALYGGLIVASPFLLWQVWLFIVPALYRRERRYAVPFIVVTALFFLTGCAFGYFVAFPRVCQFLVGMGTQTGFTPVITVNEYLSMASKIIFGLGLCFELPILVFFLARIGLVTERFLLAKFKYAVLLIFVIAAVITPTPDMMTQCVFALPMIALYLVGILIAWVFRRRAPA